MALATGTALALVAIAATAAGTGVAIAGQMEQAAAAEKAGKYNQAVAENNAQAAAHAAQFEADKMRKRNLMILGRQKAIVAKSGILDTGSALDVFMDSAVQGELDAMTALYGGAVTSNYHRSAGTLARMEGRAGANAAQYRAGGTLLTGIGSAAGSYYRQSNTYTGPSSYPRIED